MTGAYIDRCQYWQASRIPKIFVTIKFRAFDLYRVSNFIKTEALATLAQNYCHYWIHHPPYLLPKRWQVPTLTGVNIDRRQKLQKNYCRYWIHRPRFVQSTKFHHNWSICRSSSRTMAWMMTGANIGRCQDNRELLSSMNSAPSNCWLCKISWKMDNLFPRFPFPVPLFKDSLSDYNRFQDFRFQVFSNYNRCHILQEKFCVISMSNMEIKSKLGYFQVIYIGLLSRNMVSKEIIKR